MSTPETSLETATLLPSLAPSQRKVDSDLRFHFDRFAIQDVGTVPPLANGIDRRRHQHRMAGESMQFLNGSRFADDRDQYDLALDARASRQWRIDRLDAANQVAFQHGRCPNRSGYRRRR